MKVIFTQAHSTDLSIALNFFKLASEALSEKQVKQWQYWNDPPKEKVDWVKEGFENGEFYFVSNTKGDKIAMFRLLEEDVLYWGIKGKELNTRYVHSLVVPPQYSGMGVGKAVMHKIIEQLKEEKVEKFRLDCDSSNKRLCDYYEAYGFIKVGHKTTKFSVNNLYEMSL